MRLFDNLDQGGHAENLEMAVKVLPMHLSQYARKRSFLRQYDGYQCRSSHESNAHQARVMSGLPPKVRII